MTVHDTMRFTKRKALLLGGGSMEGSFFQNIFSKGENRFATHGKKNDAKEVEEEKGNHAGRKREREEG